MRIRNWWMLNVASPRKSKTMKHFALKHAWISIGAVIGLLTSAGQGYCVTAQIRVSTVPAGATVLCDGILKDASPVAIHDLAAGAHLIQAEMAGYRSSRKTVQVEEGEKVAVEIKLEKESGLVVIHSRPDGADISINGAHRGKAPLLLTDLPYGDYRVRAASVGYQDREVELRVEGRTPQKLMIDMNSDSARLTVLSKPEGASVIVDGLNRGVTPCVVDREPAGKKKIILSLDNYSSFENTVTLRAGDDRKIDVVLNPIPASLSIVGGPTGAKVYVNDQLRGQVPLSIGSIAPGKYALRIEHAGYETEVREIQLVSRSARVEEFNLIRNVGTLEIVTDQSGTCVIINGEEKGKLFAKGDNQVEVMRFDLPVGDHRVDLVKKGYFPIQRAVSIAKGETVSLKEVMKRNFIADTVVRLKSNEVVAGVLTSKLPTGDVEIETRPGIFRTLKGADIASMGPVSN